jgi:hypothetical protein
MKCPEDKAYTNLQEIDKGYQNYTHFKIEAEFIDLNDESKILSDLNVSDNDILIIEISKDKKDYVFIPLKSDE